MPGTIRVGVGGWTFEPWRGTFYPGDLSQKRELEYASRALTSIEINGTYYSSFKPDSWQKWHDETPDGFVFAVKASRFCTNRKVLADAGPSIEKFFAQGIDRLGPKLGPINWQLANTKKFDAADCDAFLSLLPKKLGALTLRHAIEVRHESFADAAFYKLAKKHGVAIVLATGSEYPEIDEQTAGFTYARLMVTDEKRPKGVTPQALKKIAGHSKSWAKRGDAFVYFISSAKVRNPAAAVALIGALQV